MIAIFLASAALCAGAGMQTLESDAIIVRADNPTGDGGRPFARIADYASGVLAEGFMRFVPPRQGERCIFDELPYSGNGTGVVFQGARPNFA